MAQTGPISSCYQCAGIHVCYGSKQPGIARDEARRAAAACELPHKGRTTEVVRVVGRERGISRKNAQEWVDKGEAVWEGPALLRFRGEARIGGAALKAAKAARRAAGGGVAGGGVAGGEPVADRKTGQARLQRPAGGDAPARGGGRWHRPGGVWRADDASHPGGGGR